MLSTHKYARPRANKHSLAHAHNHFLAQALAHTQNHSFAQTHALTHSLTHSLAPALSPLGRLRWLVGRWLSVWRLDKHEDHSLWVPSRDPPEPSAADSSADEQLSWWQQTRRWFRRLLGRLTDMHRYSGRRGRVRHCLLRRLRRLLRTFAGLPIAIYTHIGTRTDFHLRSNSNSVLDRIAARLL